MEVDLDETFCSQLENQTPSYSLRPRTTKKQYFIPTRARRGIRDLPVKTNQEDTPNQPDITTLLDTASTKRRQDLKNKRILWQVTQTLENCRISEAKTQDDDEAECAANPNFGETSDNNSDSVIYLDSENNDYAKQEPMFPDMSTATNKFKHHKRSKITKPKQRGVTKTKFPQRRRKIEDKSESKLPNFPTGTTIITDEIPCRDVDYIEMPDEIKVGDNDVGVGSNKDTKIIEQQLHEAVALIEVVKNNLLVRLKDKKQEMLALKASQLENKFQLVKPDSCSVGDSLVLTEEERLKNMAFLSETAAHYKRLYENKKLPFLNN